MKKLLFIALAFAGLQATAQTEKGKWLLGANVNYYKSHTVDNPGTYNLYEEKSSEIGSNFGFFVRNNLALGLSIGYENTAYLVDYADGAQNDQSSKMNSYKVAPMVRYYIPFNDHFKFFGTLELPYLQRFLQKDGVKQDKAQLIGISFSPGFAYFPGKKFSIELLPGGINFFSAKQGDRRTNTTNCTILSPSEFTFGAHFYLGK